MAGSINIQYPSEESLADVKTISFGCIPVDTYEEKLFFIENTSGKEVSYNVSLTYILNSIDHVFKFSLSSTVCKAGERIEVRVFFKPCVPGLSYTDYYVIEDTAGNAYRVTVTGSCFGPEVILSKKKITFRIVKNSSEPRKETFNIINKSGIEAIYQWLLPLKDQGFFQISTGVCGVIRAYETIKATIVFNGTALGIYVSELVCLVLHQEPLFLNVKASVVLLDNPLFNTDDHVTEKMCGGSPSAHLMENSLKRLKYIPSATVYGRYLDFGVGSVTEVTKNISQTLCVTNHQQHEAYVQWSPDPDNVFIIDPISCAIPARESRMFTVRFRPKVANEVYGYLMCADYQSRMYMDEGETLVKQKHKLFRIPCIGNTWSLCADCTTEWGCPVEVTLPPTVPARTTFTNFLLSNKLDTPLYFKFEEPSRSNFVVMPICGIVQSRGWQIITVALEPKTFGDFFETWDITINKDQKGRICLSGNAETSQVELMSHGFNPSTHAMYEFPPTITGCANYCTAYLHNQTRMFIHMRVLNNVDWLGADNGGSIVLPPKEIVRYQWWFFPKVHDKVYNTTITCSCVCLVDGRAVGEPREIYININGFSENPDLKVLPKRNNIHDVVVGQKASCTVTLYNNGSCFFTSKLYHEISGMDDDFSGDKLQIECPVYYDMAYSSATPLMSHDAATGVGTSSTSLTNSRSLAGCAPPPAAPQVPFRCSALKPSNFCKVTFTVTPDGAGPRQIDIKYTVLFRTEFDEIEEIQPITKKICTIWYDGIYPTIKVKRTISVKCPVILSNHCVWNICNVDELNKALVDCRPHKPLLVNLYAPDLCMRAGNVIFLFVLGCVYRVPVQWELRREKICDCEMVEVQVGISKWELRHTCIHRPLIEITPTSGVVTPTEPNILCIDFKYTIEMANKLCYLMILPNDRYIYICLNIYAHLNSKGILTPLRRVVIESDKEYLAVMNCGKVPINNLDPVIRLVWLYNPTDVFTTWRLLRGNTVTQDATIRCLLYFAEVPPLGKLSIPFAFMPTEMIDYQSVFHCSFGYDTERILVTGQGALPNSDEQRLDMPSYVDRVIRAAYRENVVFLSTEHITTPAMPTHSLVREIISIVNDTEHTMRFIWLPERIANIMNIVMTPCWGTIPPKHAEWITMTIYTLQEPATFTSTVSCEILDLTERKRYQRNEMLRKNKIDKCNQEFIITEQGTFYPGINDSEPYVLDLDKPQPSYLSLTVSISSRGQRDGFPRMLLNKMWEKTPPYDLYSTESNEYGGREGLSGSNNMAMPDIIRIIDGILWDALHSKMFRNQIEYYSKEEVPTYYQIVKRVESDSKPRLSRRVTSGICDAIVNKAVFHVFQLNPKNDASAILEAE